MAEISAYVHIGPASRGTLSGGAPTPTHVLYVWEGSTAALQLVPVDPTDAAQRTVTWIPRRPDTILEDALVMIAALVVGDAATVAALNGGTPRVPSAGPYELTDDVADAVKAARGGLAPAGLVVCVCHGSTVLAQLGALDTVEGEVEVLTSSFLRHRYGDRVVTIGHLPE